MRRLNLSEYYILYSWIPPEHEEIHRNLLNWAAWLTGRAHWLDCKAMSIEHLYRREGEREPENETNDLQAVETEDIVRAMPRKHKEHLKYLYVWRISFSQTKRRLHLSYDQMAPNLRDSREMVRNNLHVFEKKRIHQEQFSPPEHILT